MKFYESHYDDYIQSVNNYSLHPELKFIYDKFPKDNSLLKNMIFYGPSGVGKYSQVLKIIQKYSPSELKYDKKVTVQTEKGSFKYRISDVHYEVDMSLLGCNSKIIWHELFFQIIDIISVKQDKFGIIVCKNFQYIHSELLEIFYSYIQQYNHSQTNLKIKFFIITEHLSFLPQSILNVCQIINIGRPSKDQYKEMIRFKVNDKDALEKTNNILDIIDNEAITNIKEIRSFSTIDNINDVPKDIFNIICDNIIKEILQETPLSFTSFRDTLYDILTYNLDVSECLWYILSFLIHNDYLKGTNVSETLEKIHIFLKYYNNNYRPIYHLESIMFYIINKIKGFHEL